MLTRAARMLRVSITVAFAGLIAVMVGHESYRLAGVDPVGLLVAVVIGAPLVFLFVRRPVLSLVALLAATIFGLYRYEFAIGSIGLRPLDLPYALLFGRAVLHTMRGRVVSRFDIGQRALAVFAVATFLSLLPVIVTDAGSSLADLISWVRFFQAVSLVWIVPTVVTSVEERLTVLRWLVALISAELLSSMVQAGPSGLFSGRLEGRNGTNTTGLLAAILVLVALHDVLGLKRWQRLGAAAIGLWAVLASRSIGSLAALAVTAALVGVYERKRATKWQARQVLRPFRVALMALLFTFALSSLRPVNLPSSDAFQSSSTMHRLVLGTAGFEIFKSNPVFGVGWSNSSEPAIIGAPEISDSLRRRFDRAREVFFPDVSPSNVHNVYVQIAADSGAVGFAAFAIALLTIRLRCRRQLARLPADERAVRRLFYLGIIVILVWWNDTVLFGTQPDTVLCGLFLGLLASGLGSRAKDPAPVEAARARR